MGVDGQGTVHSNMLVPNTAIINYAKQHSRKDSSSNRNIHQRLYEEHLDVNERRLGLSAKKMEHEMANMEECTFKPNLLN